MLNSEAQQQCLTGLKLVIPVGTVLLPVKSPSCPHTKELPVLGAGAAPNNTTLARPTLDRRSESRTRSSCHLDKAASFLDLKSWLCKTDSSLCPLKIKFLEKNGQCELH